MARGSQAWDVKVFPNNLPSLELIKETNRLCLQLDTHPYVNRPRVSDGFHIVNIFSLCPIKHSLCKNSATKRTKLPLKAPRFPDRKGKP